MHAERRLDSAPRRTLAVGIVLAGLLWSALGFAAEAPPPPPPESEAAHQDLQGNSGARHLGGENNLDEAIFTEISPLTIPETGIALPPDQEH